MPLYNPVLAGLPSGGADGQVLTKQSATNFDADWETPSGGGGLPLPLQLPIITGQYYYPYGIRNGDEDTNNETTIYGHLHIFGEGDTFNRIGVEVLTESAGGLIRVGLYAAGADGFWTGNPLVDEELDCSTTGEKEATISFTPTPGEKYWSVSIVNQPSSIGMRCGEKEDSLLRILYGADGSDGDTSYGIQIGGQTYGTLPNSIGAPTLSSTLFPVVWLRKV